MVVRKERRLKKQLGKRTRGNGDTKNRRGAGSRGGRGLAGSHKHKFSKYYGMFGKQKKQVRAKTFVKTLNIDQLVQLLPRFLAEKKTEKSGSLLVVDGSIIGFDKILGKGEVKEKLLVKNMQVSKKAAEKIEKAGGKIESKELELKSEEEFEAEEEPAVEEEKKE